MSRPLATATGPWPGLDALAATRAVFDALGEDGMPFLPELPARGPGSDALGRTASLLVEMPVDLQPMGWRLVDHPGRDAWRATSLWGADTDALAEAADGWSGPLKLSVVGPWTLGAGLWLPRGERVVVDAGAARDLAESLAEGVALHVAAVRRLVPGADVTVQVDEPSLPAVLVGRLPTASGWGRLPPVEPVRAREVLKGLVARLGSIGAPVVLRCTAPDAPWGLLRDVGAAGLVVDVAQLSARGWESLAAAVEAGQSPWLGILDPFAATGTDAPPASAVAMTQSVRRPWCDVGLEAARLSAAVLTPTTGLAGLSPAGALGILSRLREAARAMEEMALSV